MKWKYQSSGLLLLWIYRQHFLLNSGPSLPGCVASRPNKLPYRSLTWVLHMSWKFTVAMWQCSHFQLYLSTGVVDRSPASDLEFEQGGSPLVSMPAIPVIHLLSDSQLLEKVLLWLYLINIINNKFLILNLHAHTYTFIHSCIHSLCNLSYNRSVASSRVTLHRVWYSASSLYFWYHLFSLRSSSSCVYLLPHLPIPSIFHSIICFRRQIFCKVWPIQLAFLLFIVSGIFLSSISVWNISSFLTRLVQLISILPQHHISKPSWYFWFTFRSVQVSAPYQAMLQLQHFNIHTVVKKFCEVQNDCHWRKRNFFLYTNSKDDSFCIGNMRRFLMIMKPLCSE